MPIWGAPGLQAEERQVLEHDYRSGPSRLVRQRSHIVLLADQLATQAEIARVVGCSRASVQRALARYHQGGRLALRRRLRLHQPQTRRTVGWQKALAGAMEQGPEACGVARPTWSTPLLARYLAEQTGVLVSERTVRRGLKELGYVCRRPTWVLRQRAEQEPDYLPKGKGSKRS